jgi:hypothetical protein
MSGSEAVPPADVLRYAYYVSKCGSEPETHQARRRLIRT